MRKKKNSLLLKKIASFLISIILLVFLMFVVGEYQSEITFEDQGLEAAIRKKIGNSKGKISKGALLHITRLNASGRNIQNLNGIEKLHRLEELDLDNNSIYDVTILTKLKKLKVLKLSNNKIISLKNINFQLLSSSKLRELALCRNFLKSKTDQTEIRLSDISILSSFTSLEILKLRDNNIEDITSLNNLINLKQLDLRGNKISDIGPLKKILNLRKLNLRENILKDISPVENFKKLKYLNIHSNILIQEIYPLEKLYNLETLIMQNVSVGKSINFIRNMSKLNSLNIRNCRIEDISVLAKLMVRGGLQDKKDKKATVDIRENNFKIDKNKFEPYYIIQQRWNNITYRYPIIFPVPYNIKPDFSHKSGFYREAFKLKITNSDPHAIIYYTLDGSTPNINNVLSDKQYNSLTVENRSRTYLYTKPIDLLNDIDWHNEISFIKTSSLIDIEPKERNKKAVVIRAIASSNGIFSDENIATYFIDTNRNNKYKLPVVSIATDRRNLFNYFNGIYVPGVNCKKGKEKKTGNYYYNWKKPAYFDFFDNNGVLAVSQKADIRIHGGVTRFLPQKSLRIYARSNGGINRFNYPFFSTKSIDKFNSIILRNSWGGTGALLNDVALQTLIQHLPLDTQHYQPAIVFINGEYWGIHNLRDNYNEHYIETHYKIPKNDIVILEKKVRGKSDTQSIKKYEEQYEKMVKDIINGKLNTWEKIDEFMTVSEYLDYNIVEWYAANTDWPNNNIIYWKYIGNNITDVHGPFDGRWRWMIYDIDRSFSNKDFNMVKYILVGNKQLWARELFRGILSVKDIRHEFIQRTAVHLNTTFNPKRVKNHISKMTSVLEPEIPEHSARWGLTIKEWYNEINKMKDFVEQRPFYFRKHMVEHFNEITGIANLTISNISSKADIKLHTILLKNTTPGVFIENNTWRGIMFTGEAPVKITSSNINMNFVSIEGSYHIINQTSNSLVFNIYGDVNIKIRYK